MDDRGRVRFEPTPGNSGALLSIPSDSTSRYSTGVSFSALAGLTGGATGLGEAGVRSDILADPGRLPLARLRTDAAIGEPALGRGETAKVCTGQTAQVSIITRRRAHYAHAGTPRCRHKRPTA